MRQLLERLADLAFRRPWAVLLVASLPPLLSGLLLLRTPVDLTFTGILDRGNSEVERYFEVSHRQGLGGSLLVLLEGREEQMPLAVRALEESLAGRPDVRAVVPPLDPSWWREQSPWLVERDLFDAWLEAARGGRGDVGALGRRLAATRQGSEPVGARLVQLRLDRDPLDVEVGKWQFFALEEAATEAVRRAAPGVSVAFSGLPAIAAQDQARTLGTVQRLTPLSLVAVLALFSLVERRFLGLLAVLWALLLAVVATLGLIGVLTGGLTLMETFFGVTVFGLGIDFAVHLLVRLREERARGLAHAAALLATLRGTGRGVVSGAVSTAGAFLIVALAPDPVALHVGLSGGLGLLFCLVLMLLLLPPMWTLLDRRDRRASGAGALPHHRELSVPLLSPLAGWAERRPSLCLGLSAAVLVVLGTGAARLGFETDLTRIFNRQVPGVATVQRVGELYGLNGAPWVSSARDLETARDLAARYRRSPGFAQVVTVSDFLPASAEETERRRAALEAALPELQARQVALGGLTDIGEVRLEGLTRLAGVVLPEGTSAREALESAVAGVGLLVRAAEGSPLSLDGLPAAMRERFTGAGGEILVLAYARGNTLDGREARAQRLTAQAIDPEATSLSALLEAVMVAERPWLPWVAAGTVAFVTFVLLLDFRSPRLALLALVPVLAGVGATAGILGWAGVSLSVMTVIVLPLLVGLGVDDGIHVVHRIAEDETQPYSVAAAAVGRAIVMTTLTTCASFAVLLLTDHPGLESMAWVMLVGMPICLLASVVTLPALAVFLLGRRKSAG
ncbi:MAG TPA: MMPL family transporter [Thermoanaerobaculia bacterium]|nr:MMPL family transporter [Thermoanaerobaculia bacterium]